jgi:hypothetical protein
MTQRYLFPMAPLARLLLLAVDLPQHPDEHRPEVSILLAVDQELGEGSRRRVPQYLPIRSTRSKSGSIRTRSSSAGGWTEGVEPLALPAAA